MALDRERRMVVFGIETGRTDRRNVFLGKHVGKGDVQGEVFVSDQSFRRTNSSTAVWRRCEHTLWIVSG